MASVTAAGSLFPQSTAQRKAYGLQKSCWRFCCIKRERGFRNGGRSGLRASGPRHSATWRFSLSGSVRAACQSHNLQPKSELWGMQRVSPTQPQWHDGILFSWNEFQTQVSPNWKPSEQSLVQRMFLWDQLPLPLRNYTAKKTFPQTFGAGGLCADWWRTLYTKRRFLLRFERSENGAEDESPDTRRGPGSSQE